MSRSTLVRVASSDPCKVCGSSAWNRQHRCRVCRAREARERYARRGHAEREKKRVYARAWRAANPEKERAAYRRQTYGVTDADVERMLAEQNGRCRICRVSDGDSLDHCHTSGRIRAMLCRACNAGLGMFRDDPRLLRAAASYLAKP
jgi:hypothetical protein